MVKSPDNNEIIMRLTALWAFTEAGLGGVLHLFKSPFSGLMLCGLSIIFLSMIAKYSNYSSRVIIRSLVLVVFIKMLVSPHSGVTAYFAVAFQGLLAAFIFGTFKESNLALYLFGIIAMVESAMQRLIVLTVLFGMQFWEAVNEFGNFVYQLFFDHQPEGNWFSWGVVIAYLVIYALGGAFAAWFYRRISNNIRSIEKSYLHPETVTALHHSLPQIEKSKKRKWSNYILLLLLLGFTIYFSSTIADLSGVFYILLRTILIIIVWIYIINPLLLLALKKFLKKRFVEERERAKQIQSLFPWVRKILSEAWSRASVDSGLARFENFLSWTFYFILNK
ncbi:MAG: hypothetical protein EA362_10925 [Saprospirales bacterium]|nr:MAG: hypothetical protein EA362_10925 [Saprospirales bacterium]